MARALRTYPAFESLHIRDFRWFWVGRLASSATMEMGSVAQGWLAYELTGSALALGWVTAARSIARLLLSLFGGALADRIERRKLLIWTRAAMTINALGLALLAATGTVHVWHLVLYSFMGGIISSLMMPAQKAYLADLVGNGRLLNAVSLSSVGMGLMGIIGASMAGFAIELVGVQSVFFCIVGLYIIALYTLTRLPQSDFAAAKQQTLVSGLKEGLDYLSLCPALIPLLGIAAVRCILGWTYRSLMPVYADEVLGFDASGLGILSAAPGVGSLISSMVLASMGGFRGKGKILLISGMVLGVSMIIYASIPQFALVLVFLVIVGAARNACMVTNQTLIQVKCSSEYRGRAMAMYMMLMGLMPLGTIPAGAIADAMGVPFVLTLYGGLITAAFGAFWLFRSKVRTMA